MLVDLLSRRYGITISVDTARQDISNHLGDLAEAMGISRQAARTYVTEEAIDRMAEFIGREVARANVPRARRPRHLRVVE